MVVDHAIDDDDEGAGRAADLKARPAQGGDQDPAMTAVISPACGVAPDAIAMAIASGSATTATVNPAIASSRKNAQL